jgi:hypothetical protein
MGVSGPFAALQYFYEKLRERKTMATNSGPLTEILHSEKHSKLSAEEVAKAVARHNKKHSAAKAGNATAKANTATRK